MIGSGSVLNRRNSVGIARGGVPKSQQCVQGRVIGIIRGDTGNEDVVLRVAYQAIGAESADDQVARAAADKRVVAAAAKHDARAAAAIEMIVARPTIDQRGD